jgi:hypothetical protein
VQDTAAPSLAVGNVRNPASGVLALDVRGGVRRSRAAARWRSPCCARRPRPGAAHRLTVKASGRTLATGRGSSLPGRRATVTLKLSRRAPKRSFDATLTLRGHAPTSVRIRR